MTYEKNTNGRSPHHTASMHNHHAKHTYHAIHKLLMNKGNKHAKKEVEAEIKHQSIEGIKKSIFYHYHKDTIVTDDYTSKEKTQTGGQKAVHISHHLKK